MEIGIARSADISEEDVLQICKLLAQLSGSAIFDEARLRKTADADHSYLYLARRDSRILGMALLATYPTISGVRGHIEDVVVSADARGEGIGGALVEGMLATAEQVGCRSVELTSRPSRTDAIRLYERHGFTRRETAVFRHSAN